MAHTPHCKKWVHRNGLVELHKCLVIPAADMPKPIVNKMTYIFYPVHAKKNSSRMTYYLNKMR